MSARAGVIRALAVRALAVAAILLASCAGEYGKPHLCLRVERPPPDEIAALPPAEALADAETFWATPVAMRRSANDAVIDVLFEGPAGETKWGLPAYASTVTSWWWRSKPVVELTAPDGRVFLLAPLKRESWRIDFELPLRVQPSAAGRDRVIQPILVDAAPIRDLSGPFQARLLNYMLEMWYEGRPSVAALVIDPAPRPIEFLEAGPALVTMSERASDW